MSQELLAYYAQSTEKEWARLERSVEGLLEWTITCRALSTYLPPKARVLDVGGGPGRYSLWLARRGHPVVLCDLSPELLQSARERISLQDEKDNIEEIIEADACDLSRWGDGSFGAVVCLGPFYHLPDPKRREQAAREVARVLAPNGIAIVSLMPRLSFLRRTLSLPDERHRITSAAFLDKLLEEGVFENDIPGRFTHGYGFVVEEVVPYFSQFGLEPLRLLAAEGLSAGIEGALSEMREKTPELFARAIELLWHTASEPSILGACSHLLYIGRKKNGPAFP